jgi:nonsense-mediated mRNA decay protein 3
MVKDTSGRHQDYFEAVLQLRDCKKEVIKFVEGDIVRKRVKVAKTAEVPGGIDYFLADKDFAKQTGKKLREKFGGDLKTTASLWGRKDGREVFRVTVLFRSTGFNKGDIVVYEGEEYEVKLMGKDIMLQNVKTGEKVHVKYKEMERIKYKE